MKSSPYFWLHYIQSKVRGRFRKILWPSQNIWTLIYYQVFLKLDQYQPRPNSETILSLGIQKVPNCHTLNSRFLCLVTMATLYLRALHNTKLKTYIFFYIENLFCSKEVYYLLRLCLVTMATLYLRALHKTKKKYLLPT